MTRIIDADGHIVEPRSFWPDYIEAKFLDRMPRITRDADGVERIAVGDKVPRSSIYAPAAMCIPGGLTTPESMRKLSWDDLRPGSFDPHQRLKDMDSEGIDVSVLFPSIGLGFVAITDPELATAACRAYNNWMKDFCATAPKRLRTLPRYHSTT